MGLYLQHHFDAADISEQHLFSQLLQEQDPEIMALLNAPNPSSPYNAIIRKIRNSLIAED